MIEYVKAVECVNQNAWYTCKKCGRCGREFNEYGSMIDHYGTTPINYDDEDYDAEF